MDRGLTPHSSIRLATLLCLMLVACSWSVSFGGTEFEEALPKSSDSTKVTAKVSTGDVDSPVLRVGDTWTYDAFFDVAEMISSSGVETDAEALTGELEMWVDDVTTRDGDNHSSVAYEIKSEGQFIGENITLSGTLGTITIDYEAEDIVRAGDLATMKNTVSMHVKFWISATSYIDVAQVDVYDTFYEPKEEYDFPLRVGEQWTNDYLDVNNWEGSSNFFTIPEDETLTGETSHAVVSVGDPSVEYPGCGDSYNVTAFDENGTVSSFRWWCPAAKGDAWRHYVDPLGIYVDLLLKDFEPAAITKVYDVDLEYPTWALNMDLGVWVNVTDDTGTPVGGETFVLRYEYDDVWIELTTASNGTAYTLLDTSDPLDNSPSNHDYASHGIVAYDPITETVGTDTLTLDDELVDLDYRPRPGGISVVRERGGDSMTLNPLYGFNAIPGDELTFTVPVENKGTNGGPATTLEMSAPDGTIQSEVVNPLPPVGEQILQFSWVVPANFESGTKTFGFEVDPSGAMTQDVNQSNDMDTFDVFIGRLPVVDLVSVSSMHTLVNYTLDATGSVDADGGTLHCTFEVEVEEGDMDTFEEPDCLLPVEWPDDGTFTVELTITDEENDQDFTSVEIEILNRDPYANVSAEVASSPSEESVMFDSLDSGDLDTLDPDAPLTFLWQPPSRSDGAPYECEEGPITMRCTVTPMEEGSFVMTLLSTDDDGTQITSTYTLDVTNIAPSAVSMEFTGGHEGNDEPAPQSWHVDEDDPITLSASAYDSMNDIGSLNYLWQPSSVRDPTLTQSTVGATSSIEVTYVDSGSHIIQLDVTDDDGVSAGVHTGFVTVHNVPPTVQPFGAQLPVGEDRDFQLTGIYSDTASDYESLILCWDIDLEYDLDDDRDTTNDCDYMGADVTHSWGASGTYTIRFHVTDDDGDVASQDVDVTVVNLRPKAGVSTEMTTAEVGEEVVVYSTGTTDTETDFVDVLMFRWDVDIYDDSNGDGDPANDVDAFTSRNAPLRHIYETPGVKVIRLTVSDEGFNSSTDVTITITGGETPALEMLGSTAGVPNLLILIGFLIIGGVAAGIMVSRRGSGEALDASDEMFDEEVSDDEMTADLDMSEETASSEEE